MSLGSVTVSDTASDPHPGDVVRISAAFLDEAGVAADPDVVTLAIREGGLVTTYTYGTDAELEQDSTGNYHLDLTVAEIGRPQRLVSYEWTGSGTVPAVGSASFRAVDPFGYGYT